MEELDKLRVVQEFVRKWSDDAKVGHLKESISAQISRLEDPHAEAKAIVKRWENSGLLTITLGESRILKYVRHLENECTHYRILYQHAKNAAAEWKRTLGPTQIKTASGWREAATEPLDPLKVLATAAEVMSDELDACCEPSQEVLENIRARSKGVEPYEVKQ